MKKIDKIDCCGHCPLISKRLKKNEYYYSHINGEFKLSFPALLLDDCSLPDDVE